MGIPALFRWLSDKYPKILTNVIEEMPKQVNENESIPVDASTPNPNNLEIDNLYLDMNGIIHPCCHPEDKAAPASEEEMYIEIFKYIDRIFCMIRPRKVLYMAIDGVAPRAKMNQQRSRRFRAAQEEEIKRRDEERIRLETGNALDQDLPKKKHFDSNCITPGTPFMEQLAICLRYYVIDRLNNDPGWKNIQVILSDASVPGEGEHKIMDYIRRQKTLSTYDPNTKHVLYGLDADLIMLALATHEPYFYILREDVSVKRNKERACQICGQSGHDAFNCKGEKKEIVGTWDDQSKYLEQKPFLFVHISVLREYLDVEMKLLDAPFEWNLERAVDDWVFMCFFVGNDFLPHLPSLEIREGAVELLISIWKSQAKTWDDYLTDSGDIDLDRVQSIMEELGKVEDITFKDRREGEERRRISRLERKKENKFRQQQQNQDQRKDEYGRLPNALRKSEAYIQEQMGGVETFSVKNGPSHNNRKRPYDSSAALAPPPPKKTFAHQNPELAATANKEAAKKLKMQLLGKLGKKPAGESNPSGGFSMLDFQEPAPVVASDEIVVKEEKASSPTVEVSEEEEEVVLEEAVAPATMGSEATNGEDVDGAADDDNEEEEVEVGDAPKVKAEEADSDEEAPQDDIRLWEDGWKARYYEKKFDVDVGDDKFRKSVVKSYVEGLCWVLKYYYQGVQSWKWFYPFHYSPFASDFKDVSTLKIVFEKSQPFKPIEQLMGVFPAASKQHIPAIFHHLMTDPESPIVDFYPLEFPIDLNGKKYAWQGVALLPFIDADRLLKAMEPLYPNLSPDEVTRNSMGSDVLFASSTHSNFENLCDLYRTPPIKNPVPLDPAKSGRICGTVFKDPEVTFPGSTHPSPLAEFQMPDITNDGSISAFYYLPTLPPNFKFKAVLLSKTTLPPFILDDNDKYVVRNGLNVRGRGGGRGGRGGGRGGAARRMIRHGLALTRSDSGGSYNQGSGSGYSNSSIYNRDRGDDRGGSGSRGGSPRGSPRRSGSRESYPPRDGYSRRNQSSYDDSRRDRYGTDSYGRRGGHSNSSNSRSYEDSPYMGGGGYANYNRDGKYQGSGYVPSVPSAELNSSYYGSRNSSYNDSRGGYQQQQQSYQSSSAYQSHSSQQYQQNSYPQRQQQHSSYGYGTVSQSTSGRVSYQQHQYQSYGYNNAGSLPPQQAAPNAQALVANLLSMLPGSGGGASQPSSNNHNGYGNRGHGRGGRQ